MDLEERRSQGEAARRRVLGDEYVDRSAANRTNLNGEWIDQVTGSVWHDVWTRPHFDDRTRRILVIGTMIALAKWEEFSLHVRAAPTGGGFTQDDVKEIILQQSAYCGVPAGNQALRCAAEVIADLGRIQGR